jgi:hypothetical protein
MENPVPAGSEPITEDPREDYAAVKENSDDVTGSVKKDRVGEYEQSGSLGTGTQGDSVARELVEREREQGDD